MLKNDRLLKAIRKEPVDATPIWLMRQAGRYLPEYRKVREQAGSFMKLSKTPELACEVTIQPLLRFDLDAAIIFSDILTIPDAMGLGLDFKTGEGPFFEKPISNASDILKLGIPDPVSDLRYVLDAIQLTKKSLNGKVPLIGFCGSPWTLACYMVEGGANKSFPKLQALIRENPKAAHTLLDVLAQSVTQHLNAQIEAGADIVMVFDSWGGLLKSTDTYKAFSLDYIQSIFANVSKSTPKILFTKSGSQWLKEQANSGCEVLGVSHEVEMRTAVETLGNKITLQGNLNPMVLKESPERIKSETLKILSSFHNKTGHIFNLGHGITPDVPPENVKYLVDLVHSL